MQNKLVMVDVDDTILKWHEKYLEWMESKGWHVKPREECNKWDMETWFKPHTETGEVMTPEQSLEYIIEFNSFPRALEPLKYTRVAISSLVQEGYKVIALTSFSGCPANSEFRRDYLNVIFKGCISECIILPLGACKKEVLREYRPRVFIEDNGNHAKKAIALGIPTLLLSTPYNQGVTGARYFKDWYEMYWKYLDPMIVEDTPESI